MGVGGGGGDSAPGKPSEIDCAASQDTRQRGLTLMYCSRLCIVPPMYCYPLCTYRRPTGLPTYRPTDLPTYRPTGLSIYRSTYLPTCLLTHPPTHPASHPARRMVPWTRPSAVSRRALKAVTPQALSSSLRNPLLTKGGHRVRQVTGAADGKGTHPVHRQECTVKRLLRTEQVSRR